MKKFILFTANLIFLICSLHPEEIKRSVSYEGHEKNEKQLHEVINKIIERNAFTLQDSKIFRLLLGELHGDKLIGKNSVEKQTMVKNLIGESSYIKLELIALEDLKSEDELTAETAIGNLALVS